MVSLSFADRSHRLARLFLGAALIAATAACSWFGGSTKPTPSELVPLAEGSAISTSWTVSLGAAGVGFRPSAEGDTVVAAAANGTVMRVDANSGRVLWQVTLTQPLTTGAGSDGDTIVVGGRDGSLIGLDSTGKVKWSTPLGAEVVTVPAVAQGIAVVRSSDNRISAFELDSGKRRWSFQRQAPTLALRQTGSLLIEGASVYAGLPGGRILALSVQNGAVRWEAAVSQPRGSNEIERIADVVSTPVSNGRDVCAASFQGRVACFDLGSGRGVWARELSSSAGLDGNSSAVYVVDEKDHVHAFSRTGASLWRSERLAWRGLGRPLVDGAMVLTGDRQGFVHALRTDDGAVIGRIATDGSAVLSGPVRAGRTVVVQTSGGSLVGLGARP